MKFVLDFADVYQLKQSTSDFKKMMNHFTIWKGNEDYFNQVALDTIRDLGCDQACAKFFESPKNIGYYSVQEGEDEITKDTFVSEAFIILCEKVVQDDLILAVLYTEKHQLILVHYDRKLNAYVRSWINQQTIQDDRKVHKLLMKLLFTIDMRRRSWSEGAVFQHAFDSYRWEFDWSRVDLM